MEQIDNVENLVLLNKIIKIISKHSNLKKIEEKLLHNLKDNIYNILINNISISIKNKIKTKEPIVKEPKVKETKAKEPKVKETKAKRSEINIETFYECLDRYQFENKITDIEILEMMEYFGLEIINIKKTVNRDIAIDKLFSLISSLKEEKNKHRSLSFLSANNKNNEITKLWESNELYYRNFEINTLLHKSLVFDSIYYIYSQDLFLTLNVRDKKKGKVQEIYLSSNGELEIIKEEKIKLKNLYSMYTDLFDLEQNE